MSEYFGDEHYLEQEYKDKKQAYEDEHADDWKDNPENW